MIGPFLNPGRDFMDYHPPAAEMVASVQEAYQQGFKKDANAAQYKGSDYSNAVAVERDISLERAFEIARANPEIDYFFYTKGYMMVLEIPPDVRFDPKKDPLHLVTHTNFRYDSGQYATGYCRIFCQGDAVFFRNEGKWLGSATGLADVYIKE